MMRHLILVLLVMSSSIYAFVPVVGRALQSKHIQSTCASIGRRPLRSTQGDMTAEELQTLLEEDERTRAAGMQQIAERSATSKSQSDRPMVLGKQCLRYRWSQTNDLISVEVPLHRLCTDKELEFALTERDLHIAITGDKGFAPIAGQFPGTVVVAESRYSVHSNGQDHYLAIVLRKQASPGTTEEWFNLFEGEVERPTIRFSGETSACTWKQSAATLDISFDVPDDVTGKGTHFKLFETEGGCWLSLSFDAFPSFGTFTKRFRGPISISESVWMLDEDSSGKHLNLQVVKRRPSDPAASPWWSGAFEGDDVWGA
jgi:hypothetical protein